MEKILSIREKSTTSDYRVISPINNRKLYSNMNSGAIAEKRSLKVLLVDDNIFNTMVLENLLKKMERFTIEFLKAFTGREAVQVFIMNNGPLSKSPIEQIFMDYEMPEMNGCEATIVLREKIDQHDFINCIIAGCTANMGKEDELKCFESGMDFFLSKPVTDAKIRGLLEELYPVENMN
jgi:CheY-like chemotaxis protein